MNDIQALPTHHVSAQRQPGSCGLSSRERKGQAMGIMAIKMPIESVRGHAPLADDLKKLRHDLRSCGNLKANMSWELDGGFGIGSGGSQIYIGEVHKDIQTLKHRPYRCTMMLGPLQDLRDSNCAAERWRWGPSLGVDKLAALDSNANNEAVQQSGCVRWVWGMWEKKEEKRFDEIVVPEFLIISVGGPLPTLDYRLIHRYQRSDQRSDNAVALWPLPYSMSFVMQAIEHRIKQKKCCVESSNYSDTIKEAISRL
ncbi:hypothetical protein B0H13DRAFT_1870375 [Mycena leptocephala]|nr:hypothetical protein B0H13DRAFT_1870375 [Mycena leptocephala]